MPGLLDLTQFAAAASTGQLTPGLGGSGAGFGGPVVGAPTPGGRGDGRLPPVLAKVLQQILVSDVKGHFSTGTAPDGTRWRPLRHPRPNGGDVPLRDTGVLMASFSGGSDGNSVWVGTTHPGAAIHNFGGTIRGKGKMLAIPLTKEAKRSGGPRRWKGGELQFQPTGKPRVFLLLGVPGGRPPRQVKRAGKRGAAKIDHAKLIAQFLLVDQVRIPARPFMGVSEKAWGQIGDAVADAVVRGWLSGPVGFGTSIG